MSDSHAKHHDYHLVDPSPWPLLASIGALIMAVGAIGWMKSTRNVDTGVWEGGVAFATGPWVFIVGFAAIVAVSFFWWRDVVREAHNGDHTPVVQLHLRYGMILFIASEVMFFVAWFWAYFDASLFPGDVDTIKNISEGVGMVQRNELTGGVWPPVAVEATEAMKSGYFKSTFDPWGLPLINTLILLLSGCTVTWAHHAIVHDNRKSIVYGLVLTVMLGMAFTALQAYEYGHAAFSFPGHIYGSTFFMATGFHGAHVIIGTIFLAVVLFRVLAGHFTSKQHFGFEAAAWYWHFVDVVWLFLFACIYVWGAGASAGGH